MRSITSNIIIHAGMDKVWKILTDFARYPDWNPFITRISGELATGSNLDVTLQIEGMKPASFKPRILSVTPGENYCWRGKLFVRGLFDGTHYFRLEKMEDGKTLLTQGENFQGILCAPILKRIERSTLEAFEKMNQALREQVEKDQPQGSVL